MIDLRNLLEVQFSSGDELVDYKIALGAPQHTVTVEAMANTDYWYFGFYKSFKQVYIGLTKTNTAAAVLTIEYWNGSAWVSVDGIDQTLAFTSSGFLQWLEPDDEAVTTIGGIEGYWIRVAPSAELTEIIVNFVGLMFSDDADLSFENPYIMDSTMLMGQTTHQKFHLASRDFIVQKLINRGYYKLDSTGTRQRLGPWDLLDIAEVRLASIFLTLSKIYLALSDSSADMWSEKSTTYYKKFEEQMTAVTVSLDSDDDGQTDSGERSQGSSIKTITR